MKGWGDLFKNKRITLMGLGLLGRGVGDARFFAESGADLIVTDLKSGKVLAPSVRQLRKYKNIKFVLGKHRLEDFKNRDMVIKAAGVRLDSPFILEAVKNKLPVLMSTSLFSKLTPAQIVGVTGTRGKSTVTQMLYEILLLDSQVKKKSAKHGKSSGSFSANDHQIFLGGNVRGISTLELLPKMGFGDTVVLELDSWLLQGFGGTHFKRVPGEIAEGFSPHISVFTTFLSDHLNYYDGDTERYFADKANIYRFQNDEDFLIVSPEVAKHIKKFGPKPVGKVIVARAADVPRSWRLQIRGEHNRQNAALAAAAARALNVPEKIIRQAVESFKGLPGRLELVRKYKGIEFYNDTTSTTPDALIAALDAFKKRGSQKSGGKKTNRQKDSDRKTVLIFGGADKKLEHSKPLSLFPKHLKALVVLPGTGTEKIKKNLDRLSKKSHGKLPIMYVKNMRDAIKAAIKNAKTGGRILMSPGFASFGLFQNEFDRGDQFTKIVRGLK